MTDEPLLCVACHDEPAVEGAFLGPRCLPEPEPEPEPPTYQPSLFEATAA